MRHNPFTFLLFFALAFPLFAASTPEWVKQSNQNSEILLQVLVKYSPEMGSRVGLEGHDTEVTSLPLDVNARTIADLESALQQLEPKLATEKDPSVLQDLRIMTNSANLRIEGIRLGKKYNLPYFDIPLTVFQGLRGLLDEQVAAERRGAALVRLRKYAGLEPGTTPLTRQAMAYTRAHFDNKDLIGPFKDNLVKDMANSARYVSGIEELFKKFKIAGYEAPFAEFKKQIDDYEAFLQKEVMPRVTTDFRLPPELYRFSLKQFGNDMPVEELVSRAKTSFREIQNEMNAIAPLVAKQKGFKATDYHDVIRELKKQQFSGDAILPHYQARMKEIEEIIVANHLLTLPEHKTKFRIASEAETAATPAPHMDIPRLIGNTGEQGAFVLPLRIPSENGKGEIGLDDFTFDAASWTLSAHEARPGHELQFASVIEKGVSVARALFAFNSVNVEGWGLYAEAEMKPYEPLEGQLIALQHRLMRSARAFLDPSLQLGRMTRAEAYHVLEDEVMLSHAMATQEVERYTFWAPGQAPSYFVGYSRLMELRTDAERILAKSFDRQSYHDFILGQGLVPPSLLREAVMNDYVKPRAVQAANN
ncbi:MAG TPA: DUF885 domain-containing protein [Candidatus Limnocylindrales bacterium]|nr:DUF885 domain-containing protein [Candidatus Limnocylindrales bacterium]